MNTFIITSADTKSGHLDFLPLWSAAWKKFFPEYKLALCVVKIDEIPCPKWAFDYVDYIQVVDGINGIYPAVNAKFARLYLSTILKGIVSFNDIDLIPLQKDFYHQKLSQHKDGFILRMGKEVYSSVGHDVGKVPMSAFTADSSIFEEIINKNQYDFRMLLLTSIDKYKLDPLGRDNPLLKSFSDESYMRACIENSLFFPNNIIDIERGYDIWTETVDRAAWKIDEKKLYAEKYKEAHFQAQQLYLL